MALYYNPFDFLTETYTYPHARTLRTSYFQKLRDASRVFAGRYWVSEDGTANYTLGMIDYLTFGVFVLPVIWADWCERHYTESLIAKILYLPVNFLEFLVKIVRWMLAITFVLITSLFIAVIHGISRLFQGNPLKLLDIQGQEKTTEAYVTEGSKKSLREVLQALVKKKRGIDGDRPAISDAACLSVHLETKYAAPNLYFCDPRNNCHPVFVFSPGIATNQDRTAKQETLYRLNVFGATAEMEKRGVYGPAAQAYQDQRRARGLHG